MPFTLNPDEPIRRGLKQLIRRQLRGADKRLREDGEGAVHEARKSVKKARAIVELLQQADTDALGEDKRRLRAAGRALSILRDSDAVIASFDLLRTRFPRRLPEHTNGIIRRQLARRKTRIARDARDNRSLAKTAHTLRAVRRSVKHWAMPAIDALDLPDLLKASYRASRKAMNRARKTTAAPDLHQWRKRVKTLWYHLRLAESLAPGLRGEIQRFKQLETWLGEHHNLSVLQAAIADDDDVRHQDRGALRALMMMSGNMQRTFARKAFTLGRRLLDGRPGTFARDVRRALSASPRKSAFTRRDASPKVA
jgi:CHAD domain-containing protein